jgi:beta-alanine degradation protein BauB
MLVFVVKTAMAQDVVKVAPESYKVLLENDRVRVLEYRLKPGAKEPMHSHPDYIVYAFSSGKAKFTFPDGKTMEREIKAGKTMFIKTETHTVENVGTTTAHGLLIELKEPQKK